MRERLLSEPENPSRGIPGLSYKLSFALWAFIDATGPAVAPWARWPPGSAEAAEGGAGVPLSPLPSTSGSATCLSGDGRELGQ